MRAAGLREPLVAADDLAVLRGEAVFETLRVVGPRAHAATAHLDRLQRSAAALDLTLPPRGALEQLVAEAAAGWPTGEDASLRLVATKGSADAPGVTFALVSAIPVHTVTGRLGVHAVTLGLGVPAGLRAASPWLLPGVKCSSYAVPMAALRAAAEAGGEEAVWVSLDGEVLEAATSNVAWIGSDGVLVTPPPDEVGVLPGTTVAEVLDHARARGVPVVVRRGRLEELRGAREAMLLSSVRGVAPLLSLDRTPVGDGVPGLLTLALQADVEEALRPAPDPVQIPLDATARPT